MVFDNTGSVTSFSSLLSTFGGSASQSSETTKPPMTIPLLRAAPPKPSTTAPRASSSATTATTTTVKQSLNGAKPTNGLTKQARTSPPVAGVKRKASDVNINEGKDRPKPEAPSSAVASKAKPPKPTFGPAKMKTEPVSKPATKVAAKPTTATSRPTTTAQPSTSTTSTSGSKLSYKELMMERSKQQRATTTVVGLPPPGLQPLKKTFTKEKKGWQKEILEKREAKTTKATPGLKLEKDVPGGKVEFGSAKMKGTAAVGGKGKGLAGGKGRPEPPAPKQPPPKPLFGPDLLKKRKEEAAPPVAKRQKVPGREVGRDRGRQREPPMSKRYVYAEDYESDYDSADSSDMEATGLDILEEERFSERVAVKEDLREQRKEEQLAAIKAARRMKS